MFSKTIRRIHMYLGLFFMPWMLMYALSTMLMNHGPFFREPPQFAVERQQNYTATFPANAEPRQMAAQILSDLGMDGPHAVGKPGHEGRLTINRMDPVTPRRITFTPSDGQLIVERQLFHAPAFLERLHRRRGFQQPYLSADAWGLSVDLVIMAMVLWLASGLWMWWEMRVTRRLGALSIAAGLALFAFFVLTI